MSEFEHNKQSMKEIVVILLFLFVYNQLFCTYFKCANSIFNAFVPNETNLKFKWIFQKFIGIFWLEYGIYIGIWLECLIKWND